MCKLYINKPDFKKIKILWSLSRNSFFFQEYKHYWDWKEMPCGCSTLCLSPEWAGCPRKPSYSSCPEMTRIPCITLTVSPKCQLLGPNLETENPVTPHLRIIETPRRFLRTLHLVNASFSLCHTPRRHSTTELTCPCKWSEEIPAYCEFSLAGQGTDWTRILTVRRSRLEVAL